GCGPSVNVQRLAKDNREFSQVLDENASPQALAVRDDGAAAWVTGDDKKTGWREVDAVTATARDGTPLANAKGIDVAGFAIDGDGVHWIQDGTPRSAQPVAPLPAPDS